MINKLSPGEKARFAICKKQIADGLQTCFDTGMALTEIRDSKLYREDFDTFAEFCQQTYQLGKSHAYRLIESAEMKMSPVGDKITNERQVRALAAVPPEQRAAVVEKAVSTGHPLTAKTISEAAKPIVDAEIVGKEKPATDKIGYPIPADLMPLWNRTAEVQKFLSQLSEMRGTLRAAQESKDPLWGGLSYSGALADLGRTYTSIECAKPYAVCPKCQGRLTKNCLCCKGRGFVSQYLWDSTITREEKAIRAKVIEKLKGAAR